jgi:hypothetical protein
MYTIQFIYLKINNFFNYLFDILTTRPSSIYEQIDEEDNDEEIIYINEPMKIER